nr:aspartate aminotransferase family protein [Paracoccus denitrificans]
MLVNPNSAEARDIAYHFHAYTDARKHAESTPLILDRGEGVHVYDSNGKRYLEGMAGLWSVAVGFGERRLIDAATRQMERLSFYHNFTGRTHMPAIDLAEKLVTMAPVPMSKAYFTNSGSEANDSAIKMIWYRSNALGQPQRKKIIARERAYHGITVASGSLTGLPANHRSFDLPIANILHTGSPHHWRDAHPGESEEEFSVRRARELEELILAEGPDTIAAFFAEPVMGAGGVVVPPRGYWEAIQAVLRKYDILLVADEVVCGFGRTGRMFGSQTYDMRPDIMVLSKALSSSYLPISALVVNDKVFEPIADETHRIGTFGHGFTGGAHPVAAAVALENIRIIEERDLVGNAARVGQYLRDGLQRFADHPLVGEVRGVGMIAALELVKDNVPGAANLAVGGLGARTAAHLIEAGVILRPMHDALAICPPLILQEDHADELVSAIGAALDKVLAELFET